MTIKKLAGKWAKKPQNPLSKRLPESPKIQPKVLYFPTIWPIQKKSAACQRVKSISSYLAKNNFIIKMFCSAKINTEDKLFTGGINQMQIDPNDHKEVEKHFNKFDSAPEFAIFDTFISEEKYSHFVKRYFPNCIKILDTQD